MIHAPADGSFHALRQAGEKVRQGEVIAYVGAAPVYASLTGILRGAIRDGFEVKSGLKIMDIDPRVEERNQCFCISDKAKRIADSVCETIWEWEEAQKPLYERLALDPENHRVVSFVGAGGKTTLIYRPAEELAALGSRVIVTTTTHMEKPQEYFSEWGEELFPDRGTYMTIGVSCEDGKIRGMEREAYQTLREHTDYLFIEADGSV